MKHSIYQVLVCLTLIIGVYLFAKGEKLKIEKDILISFFRALFQVTILSFIILKLFNLSNIYTFFALILMAMFGTVTANKHGKFLKNSFTISLFSMYISSFSTIFLLIIFNVIENKPEIIIPLSGMIIGNVMNSISLSFDRLNSELSNRRNFIETMLSLGFSSNTAFKDIQRSSIKVAMIPKIDNMKSLGLVWIPGLMAGMILGGANPLDAAVYQIIIIVMIVVSSFISAFLTVRMAKMKIFNSFEQLVV